MFCEATQVPVTLAFKDANDAQFTLSSEPLSSRFGRVLAHMRVPRSDAVFRTPLALSHVVEPTPGHDYRVSRTAGICA